MNRKVLLVGLILVAPLIVMLASGLLHDPREVISPLIGLPAPEFALLDLDGRTIRLAELRGSVRGITVYDDFAHHPTAIRTTLDGLRRNLDSAGNQARVLAVFEPRSNTMKLGAMKSQLPWALESADLAFCHTAGLDWDAAAALAPLGVGTGAGQRAETADNIAQLLAQVVQAAQPGDHIVCMSNGAFGGIHQQLLDALAVA